MHRRKPLHFLLLRSDDLERLLRGAWSGGFNLGTGLVAFGNVPRLSAYPPDPAPHSYHVRRQLRNDADKEVELPAPPPPHGAPRRCTSLLNRAVAELAAK